MYAEIVLATHVTVYAPTATDGAYRSYRHSVCEVAALVADSSGLAIAARCAKRRLDFDGDGDGQQKLKH